MYVHVAFMFITTWKNNTMDLNLNITISPNSLTNLIKTIIHRQKRLRKILQKRTKSH